MPSPSYDFLFKILLVGDSDVGKSSLLLKFTEGRFDEKQASTVGVDFKVKYISSLSGVTVKATIWDTAGQERFRTLTSSYYRGAQGILFIFDVCSRASFDSISSFLSEVEQYSDNFNMIEKVLVANKVDKESERKVTKEEAETFAGKNSLLYFETSAKTDSIESVFKLLVERIILNPQLANMHAAKKKNVLELANQNSEEESFADNCCFTNL